MAVYDATSPEARKFYWDEVNKGLFSIGVDAWWMDTTEPETEGQEDNILLNHKLAAGSGNRYVNVYPLLDTEGVYQGQRSASDKKRVFILSRSAFAGSQRNGVTAWSGDINSDWFSFRRQIPAGLNYSLSGAPYWTTDIGGFVFGSPTDPAFRELFIRWFQYGTFNPILRVHGTRNPDENELWSYGPDAQKILVDFDRLRYRMLPYIYSLAWKTTSEAYTPMRPLVMDFRGDPRAENIGDQFMYGPAFLVNPVTEPAATTRQLYLPQAKWYDFWTGVSVEGGRMIDAATTLDRLPLYVRAGSILPLRTGRRVVHRKTCRPDRASHLPRCGWRFHSLRRRERQLQLREGRVCDHSAALGRRTQCSNHRRAQGTVPRHAGEPRLPRGLRKREAWSWNQPVGSGQGYPVLRQADYGHPVKCASMPTSTSGSITSASTTGSTRRWHRFVATFCLPSSSRNWSTLDLPEVF